MLTISIDQIPLASFALAVNNVAIIRNITIKNSSPDKYSNLKVRVSFDPEFADAFEEHIDLLPSNDSWSKSDIQPPLKTTYLCNLTEKISARTTVQLISDQNVILAEASKSLEVLDYCQYWGNSFMSQYLAAFVTPRHIALDPIIKRASELLAQWTGSSALSGYNFDVPNRPKMIIGAIYEAIAEQNITYCSATATLTKHGQKIRTCEELLSANRGKRGCSLDMALLMCSCLEAVGMHPLLILQDEHAYAGCWLVNELFADSINDDPSVITKRTADGINEILLVEATGANEGNNVPFESAIVAANDNIQNIGEFCFVLDVVRARLVGVQPIPQRIYNGNEYEVVNDSPTAERHLTPASVSETFVFKKDENEPSRFDLWERRLLDLSTRNNLLNIHLSNNTLRLMTPSLADMVKQLYKNREIQILECPGEWNSNIDIKDLDQRISVGDSILSLLRKELDKFSFRSYQQSSNLTKILTHLYRTARLTIEECGANTLYIALGFLKWYEVGKALPHFAPIVLYPIRLERKSSSKGYYIVSRGEDPLLNETLFELLKQSYGIEIPDVTAAIQSENGLDIGYILAAVRKAIMEQDRWDVIEESTISIFDFNRFVIWNDIRTNRQAMSKHPLIGSLVEGKLHPQLVEDGIATTTEAEVSTASIALPISADSSQLAAISKAATGSSFVLHGPPGTGKSQTITNIISNALFQGKQVLFVAEKMAALEVVQRRLAAVGLDPFCLELHSNKTKKSLVMDQLRKTTEVVQQLSDDTFEKQASHLDELKSELNAHVTALHKVRGCGLSVYDCFVRYSEIALPDSATVKFGDGYIAALNSDRVTEHTELVENYQSVAKIVAEYRNALHEVATTIYSPELRNNIEGYIEQILPLIARLQSCHKELYQALGLSTGRLSREQYNALNSTLEVMLNGNLPTKFIASLKEDMVDQLGKLAKAKKICEERKEEILSRFDKHILDIDYRALQQRWIESGRKWFLAKYLSRRRVTRTLSAYALNGKRLEDAAVINLLDTLRVLHKGNEGYDQLLDRIDSAYHIGNELADGDSSQLSLYFELAQKLHTASISLGKRWGTIAAALSKGTNNNSTLEEYNQLYTDITIRLCALEQLTASKLSNSNGDYLAMLSEMLSRWGENIGNLRSKVSYNIIRKQMLDSGIGTIVEAFESGKVKQSEIAKTYLKSVYKQCADYYISQNEELNLFQSILFEDKIKRFRKLCKDFEQITRRELFVRMGTMLPALRKEAAQSSDVGYLQKCIRNGCRGVSIRKLFEAIPDLISRMCPAMLMSPLSVSQYLGENWPQFDLVIFDEASQMPTCEAVAAISRGKSAIIVGDEHQLPPTNFFMADNFSEQHSECEDLESILEDCLALSMPQKHLLWHYRSKHESLITFSNHHFYDNSLLTFPSNDDMATKVGFEYIKGLYERGGGRNNKEEAKAVVKEIQRRLSSAKTASESIGVVTFNVHQQSLIEDMLGEMLRRNPDLEVVAQKMHEPIFIKNLENVQGDERDVILFSVGFGRDKFGKMTMNFGPLNRDGGQRRLNVAVSRARYEMKVFSSLRAEDIDLNRTNAKGVKYLKAFLSYAEKGNVALMQSDRKPKNKAKDAFVESVAKALQAKGYSVNTNIGSSEYRVDIGVIDPQNPQRYILGLLCDGYNYTTSTTAYDRNVTTPAVLALLGWKTLNIWSVEWWDTPEHVLNTIIQELERIQANGDEDVDTTDEDTEYIGHTNEVATQQCAMVANPDAEPYTVAALTTRYADSTLFSQGYYTDTVVSDIHTILEAEAPISRRLLIKRIISNYGIARNGARINSYLTNLFSEMNLVASGDDIFYWRDSEQLNGYSAYRLAAEREALDIAPEEVAVAIMQVLREQFAIDDDGLISQTARLFGYGSVRDNVAASIRRGINYALSRGLIQLDTGRYKIA